MTIINVIRINNSNNNNTTSKIAVVLIVLMKKKLNMVDNGILTIQTTHVIAICKVLIYHLIATSFPARFVQRVARQQVQGKEHIDSLFKNMCTATTPQRSMYVNIHDTTKHVKSMIAIHIINKLKIKVIITI